MRFNRCPWPKDHKIELTPRRIAAARRRLARERDKVALLPDLVAEVPTLDADLAALQASAPASSLDWREHWARNWRRARRQIAALPPLTRLGVQTYWARWSGPLSPEYLLTMAHEAELGRSYWSEIRLLRQYWLIGQKRFPTDRIRAVFARTKPGPFGRTPGFYAARHFKKQNRKRGIRPETGRAFQMALGASA